MFYTDECVRSRSYGLGVVVASGEDPCVKFLDGPEWLVDGRTLRIVPGEVYDAEVRNRWEIER